MTESFADHPPSVAELRAERAEDGRHWTVRDALISLLRDIDSGKVTPTDAVLVYAVRETEAGSQTHFVCAGPGGCHVALGMLARASWMINDA
jgi:hypothetical protein